MEETKICRKCGQSKPLERFSKGRATCKDCQAAYKRGLRKGEHTPRVAPSIRVCRECGKPETEVEFRPRANICVPCFKAYLKEYRKKNREKLRKQIQDWKDTNREQYRESARKLYHTPEGKKKHRARVCKTPRTWMSHLLSITRAIVAKPGPHDPKSGPQLDFDIDLDFLCSLYEAQDGKCAVTGVKMTHKFNDLAAISVDRIDSKKGHTKDNVHLICQWVNFAKRHHDLEDFKRLLADFLSLNRDGFLRSSSVVDVIDDGYVALHIEPGQEEKVDRLRKGWSANCEPGCLNTDAIANANPCGEIPLQDQHAIISAEQHWHDMHRCKKVPIINRVATILERFENAIDSQQENRRAYPSLRYQRWAKMSRNRNSPCTVTRASQRISEN
jgi:hypothetical protein